MKIVLYPDEPLTRVAEPVTDFGPKLEKLAEDMLETMYDHDGVGLAAPQVGISKRLFVLHEPGGEPMCLINPEITESQGAEYGDEGCLSVPEVYGPVPRATRIRVRAFDVSGKELDFEAHDFLARIIQHENDHLDGRVFLARLDVLTQQVKMQEWQEARERLTAASNPR